MLRRAFLAAVLLLAASAGAPALAASSLEQLQAVLRIDDSIAIMREEGLQYGEDLNANLLEYSGKQRWRSQVDGIYDIATMQAIFAARLEAELADKPDTVAGSVAFFGSELGQRVLGLELAARRSMLDSEVEDASYAMLDELRAEDDPRLAAVEEFMAVNDLVEQNVTGAMNANYAFYRALVDGGAMGFEMPEDEILADVWAQEDAIRDETTTWLMAFLSLAYRPLSDEDMAAYVAFSSSPEGQQLNQALFAAFDAMFVTISRQLGAGAAEILSGQDI